MQDQIIYSVFYIPFREHESKYLFSFGFTQVEPPYMPVYTHNWNDKPVTQLGYEIMNTQFLESTTN
jgi:hypothetical protein